MSFTGLLPVGEKYDYISIIFSVYSDYITKRFVAQGNALVFVRQIVPLLMSCKNERVLSVKCTIVKLNVISI